MIDGAHDSDKYPSDFFVDLIFSDVPKEQMPAPKQDPECKDAFWNTIGKLCAEKRKLIEKNEAAITKSELLPRNEPAPNSFVIDEGKEGRKRSVGEEEKKPAANIVAAKSDSQEPKSTTETGKEKEQVKVGPAPAPRSTAEETKKTENIQATKTAEETAGLEQKKEESQPPQNEEPKVEIKAEAKAEETKTESKGKAEKEAEAEEEDVDALLNRIENEVLP